MMIGTRRQDRLDRRMRRARASPSSFGPVRSVRLHLARQIDHPRLIALDRNVARPKALQQVGQEARSGRIGIDDQHPAHDRSDLLHCLGV